MRSALLVETWKVRRSPAALASTAAVAVLMPLLALGMYSVGLGTGADPLSLKARAFVVEPGWVGFLGVVEQIAAVAVFLAVGVVVTWSFGREHAERTFGSLFALPVSRSTIAVAKFIVLGAWVMALTVVVVASTAVVGIAGGVSERGGALSWGDLVGVGVVALGAGVLALPLGWVASVARGYIVAFVILVIIVAGAQVFVLTGAGGWFPFAVPGLIAVQGVPGIPALSWIQITLVPIVVAAGVAATIRWWQSAESIA